MSAGHNVEINTGNGTVKSFIMRITPNAVLLGNGYRNMWYPKMAMGTLRWDVDKWKFNLTGWVTLNDNQKNFLGIEE